MSGFEDTNIKLTMSIDICLILIFPTIKLAHQL